jgi:hypothetical protein
MVWNCCSQISFIEAALAVVLAALSSATSTASAKKGDFMSLDTCRDTHLRLFSCTDAIIVKIARV